MADEDDRVGLVQLLAVADQDAVRPSPKDRAGDPRAQTPQVANPVWYRESKTA
ncbi:hypothetical protein [Streptomyces wuyuanensis]|uniref:hypothetical protein n=1 Tax=Streptomyces wuyuanensis TaxID=1196353 RepID=UPI0034247A40